jgi:hypothetical protein
MQRIALLGLSVFLLACCRSGPARPDLPESVPPGWKLISLAQAAAPPEVPAGAMPDCWQANYAGAGTARIWLCRYNAETSAFDAAQRARAGAQTVKFQEGEYLVLVQWNNAPKADLTALVRTVQKTIGRK